MMDGFAQPAFSFAKFCAQFNHNWKVPVQVKPITIMAMDSNEKFVCFKLAMSPSDLPSAFCSESGSGNRKISTNKTA